MKVSINSDDEIIVFLNNSYIEELNFTDRRKTENYFKSLFQKLSKNYDIEMNGFYNVNVYINKHYGYILEINIENTDYYTYFGNQIDMKINLIKDNNFLYEIDFLYLEPNLLKYCHIYRDGKKLYLKIKNDIDNLILGELLEKSNIIYGESSKQIIKDSVEVRI